MAHKDAGILSGDSNLLIITSMKTTLTSRFTVQPTVVERYHEVDFENLEFGKIPTDHMFVTDYDEGQWRDQEIVPYAPMQMTPFTSAFHYGQTVFEGMKAFRLSDGRISIFRPRDHARRFNRSLERMCMPPVPEALFTGAMDALISLDRHWVPKGQGTSLYIRPFMIATDDRLGVKVADHYRFMIVCSPVGAYYLKPIRVKVEQHYARAFRGGTGFAKCGGNYGMSFYPYARAVEEGFDQVIWTDAETHEFVEESGTMNIGFIRNDTLITPPAGETVLAGITRDSLLKIAVSMGMKVEERLISYRSIAGFIEKGERIEAFGIGTAATVAPIRELYFEGKSFGTYTGPDATMFRLKRTLEDIRTGLTPDRWGWNHIVSEVV